MIPQTQDAIKEAKAICDTWKAPLVVVVAFNPEQGKYQVASYGQTKALCAIAKRLGVQIGERIHSGEIEP